jgi:cytochrome P450
MIMNSLAKSSELVLVLSCMPCDQSLLLSGMLFGANDSTSGAIARVLHVLANHSAEQDRLRKEVTDARAKHGDLGYDPLIALPFLDAVVKETLRL